MAAVQNSGMTVTENTKFPFGKYKRKRLRDCPDGYLRWVAEHLLDTDFHEFAYIAGKVLVKREKEDTPIQDLEFAADEFLKSKGINPKKL